MSLSRLCNKGRGPPKGDETQDRKVGDCMEGQMYAIGSKHNYAISLMCSQWTQGQRREEKENRSDVVEDGEL
jgi:hypothetical protein